MGREEFDLCCNSDIMIDYLASLGMSPKEAQEIDIFSCIDADDSGAIDPEELVSGLFRLTGSARAVDVLAFVGRYYNDISYVKASIHELMRRTAILHPKKPTFTPQE